MSPIRTNPFPGLRPFEFQEHKLFFGREEQYEQMAEKLSNTRFLAVVGTSGSGKSSLVRAGLLPALCEGIMSARTKWRIALFRPKDDPIRELAEALNRPNEFTPDFSWNGSTLLSMSDVLDWPKFITQLGTANGVPPGGGKALLGLLPEQMQQAVSAAAHKKEFEKVRKFELVEALNQVLRQRDFSRDGGFEGVSVTDEARRLLSRGQEHLSDLEVQRLNRLLLEACYPSDIARYRDVQTKLTEVTLRRGDRGLVEEVRQAKLSADESLVIVVDQFEELFRYARISENGPHGNQAAAFVKLLLQAKSQREFPIYIVLTMRSDYLGDCAKFWDLPEAINESQYLIPRLTRDQRREAIKGPIKMRGADITPQLVNQLLNDMGDSPDQLPVLQHALMRTWDRWEADHVEGEPINLGHYEAIGAMANALSLHADEAFDELPDKKAQIIAEKLFKCLTERGTGEREIRRPTELREIGSVIRADLEDIAAVIDVFRRDGRSFLLPTSKKPIERTTSIDISHESLIRNWKRLAEWVNEEAKSADTYRRLAESAQLYKDRGTELLPEVEVPLYLKWREQNEPNRAWASRYHPYFNEDIQKLYKDKHSLRERKARDKEVFERSLAYLAESRREAQRKAEERERKRKENELQRKRQLRRTQIVAAVLLALTIFGWWWYVEARWHKDVANYLIYAISIQGAQGAADREDFAYAYELLNVLREKRYNGMRGLEWDLLSQTRNNDWSTVLGGEPVAASYWNSLWGREPAAAAVLLAAAFSQEDNALATVSADGTVKLWGNDGKWVEKSSNKRTKDGSDTFSSVTFSPDGKTFASIDSAKKIIKLWGTHNGEEFTSFDGVLNKDPNAKPEEIVQVTSVAFSPDGKLLACLCGKRGGSIVQTWDIGSGTKLEPIEVKSPEANFTALAFSRDGRSLALGKEDGFIEIRDIYTRLKTSKDIDARSSGQGGEQGQPGRRPSILALAFSPRGDVLASASDYGFIKFWGGSGEEGRWKFLHRLQRQVLPVMSLVFSQGGQRMAAVRRDGSVRLWDLGTKEELERLQQPMRELATLKGHAGDILSVAFSANADLIATVGADKDKDVRVWDVNQRRRVTELKLTSPVPVKFLALSPDEGRGAETLVLGRADSRVELWEIDRGGASLKGELKDVLAVAVSRDKKSLATLSVKGEIDLRDTGSGESRVKFTGDPLPADEIATIAFSPDGKRLAVWSKTGGVKLYDLVSKTELPTQWRNTNAANDSSVVAFSPDLYTLAVGKNDGTIELLITKTGAELKRLKSEGNSASVLSIAFSRDGHEIATGRADKTVSRWDVSTGKDFETLAGHDGEVLCVEYSEDGTRLATGSADGTVKLWDIDKQFSKVREQLRSIIGPRELITLGDRSGANVLALTFSPGGKTLVTSTSSATTNDNVVKLW
jgi:WD40 repeat protein